MIRRVVRHVALSLALCSTLAACVPSTEESDPRGALGLTTVPSAGSRGEPFVTTDGWTIYVEELALLASIVGGAVDKRSESDNPEVLESSHQGPYLFRASSPESFVAPGLPIGPGIVRLPLSRLEAGHVRTTAEPRDAETRNVPPELVARFVRPSESFPPTSAPSSAFELGPSIVLVARAEKGDRVVRIDFAFHGAFRPFDGVPLEIRANALNSAPVSVVAENLFAGLLGYEIPCNAGSTEDPAEQTPIPSFSSSPVFDDLASTDTDGDGILSAVELRTERAPKCDCCSPAQRELLKVRFRSSMADVLVERSGAVIQL